MALNSMTGFARSDGNHGPLRWHWELRSVNGRGLDVRLRLPPGMDGLEPRAREAITRRIARGSVTANLSVRRDGEAVEVRLNERTLEQVLRAVARVRELTGAEPMRAEAVLGVRGVLEVVEVVDTEAEIAQRNEAIAASLDTAVADLVASRAAEGARLAVILGGQIDEVARLVELIAASPGRRPEAIAARLRELIARVVETGVSLDPQRVHQEAVMIATRADVEEELRRLGAHVAAARQLMAVAEPVGRKLDFLAQEFFREANTLTSKSNEAEITAKGLELKSIIDQMREQVQNIE